MACEWRHRGGAAAVLTLRLDRAWPAREVLPCGVEVIRCEYPDLNLRFPRARGVGLGLASQLLVPLQVARAVRRLAAGFDVLHVVNLSYAWSAVAVRAARGRGLPVVARPANSDTWFDLTLLERQPLWGRWGLRTLLRDVSRWQAISGAVASDLGRAGVAPERIVAVPTGVTIPGRAAELPERAARFLYLGRIASGAPRDFHGLVHAFGRVAATRPAIELAMVGDGDRLEEVRAEVRRAGLGDRIRADGAGDPARWLAWADCLVQPSYVEGMSNAVLEAMAQGLPTVAYDVPPNREALAGGQCGLLVPVDDREALAAAIASLADTPGLARRLGAAARARAERVYAIGRVVDSLAGVYDELLRRP